MKENKETFEDILKSEFIKRKKMNPSYSLRGYAKSLGIQASPLSAILNGKRPVTNKMKYRLGLALKLNLTNLDQIKTNRELLANYQGVVEYKQLDIDSFEILSRPFYFAVLELFELHDFQEDIKWMAKKLSLSNFEVKDALERLLRVGFLEKLACGRIILKDDSYFTTSLIPGLTDESRKRMQKNISALSIESIDQVSIENREHTSVTFAINKSDLNKAREITNQFRADMAKLFNKNNKKTDVYQLHIGLFPLTK